MKPVYCYLLIHPDWAQGFSRRDQQPRVGRLQRCPAEATACWYDERLKGLHLVEVRGRIKISEDTSHLEAGHAQAGGEDTVNQSSGGEDGTEDAGDEAEDRKQYGLPRFLALANGQRLDTRRGTVPRQSYFACVPAVCHRTSGNLSRPRSAMRHRQPTSFRDTASL